MNSKTSVSLFIPCIVEQVYPQIGLDMAKIIRHLGFPLTYHSSQTCCGQPAFNAGFHEEARQVAANFIRVFKEDMCIVGPSGSCVSMIRNHYQTLFRDHELEEMAVEVADRVFEFSEFISEQNLLPEISGQYTIKAGFHNSCHSYRELGITESPFMILERINGLQLMQPQGEPVCCGFGGMFSFKYPQIAETMGKSRIDQFLSAGAEIIISNDPGCIMHMRQEAKDRKLDTKIFHLTEFLALAMGL